MDDSLYGKENKFAEVLKKKGLGLCKIHYL